MEQKYTKNDLSCRWVTQMYGDKWEGWRIYADEWLHIQIRGLQGRMNAIQWFLEYYLITQDLPYDPALLFTKHTVWPDLVGCMKQTLKSAVSRSQRNNLIIEFIDWIIYKDYCEPNDNGVPTPLVKNPFIRIKQPPVHTESVLNPLPYKYMDQFYWS
jgi:hypothetical protein